ncbi:MAG: FKBP-type peptidyl-prolyl cis-trans isomerase [Proteobacteria bacterium]|nr:FKBP-type peptidyl-prolyl cis-trans isomerase [Pseudomonadota bacterium]
MKIKTLVALSAVLVFATTSVFAKDVKQLITEKQKVSYSIGLSLGNNFKQQGIDIDTTTLVKGIEDAIKGANPLLTQEQIREVMTNLQKNMMAKKQKADAESAGKNKTDGELFLAKNKSKKGIVTLPSGLQYQVVRKGTGATPKATDTVVTNYEGTLIDGRVFDSSYKRGKPATFPVNGVIKGWTEALQLMKTGAKWKLFIPSELAYGARSAGPIIGPNSTLIFDIELLEIK